MKAHASHLLGAMVALAATVVMVLPIIAVFFVAQRAFIQGIVGGDNGPLAKLIALIPDPNARAAAKEAFEKEAMELAAQASTEQLEINKTEAAKALSITRLQAGGGTVQLFSALKKRGVDKTALLLWSWIHDQ